MLKVFYHLIWPTFHWWFFSEILTSSPFLGEWSKWSRSVMSDSLWPRGLWLTRLLRPCDSPGKNTGVDCHFLLQGIFPTQGLNPCLPHCKQTLNHLSHQGSPLYCGVSLLWVGLHQWLVKVSWLGKPVSVFWWVELDFFSLEWSTPYISNTNSSFYSCMNKSLMNGIAFQISFKSQ